MRLLLDTHAFLWFVWNDPQLSQTAKNLLEMEEHDLFLSAASTWEIAIKISTGKLSVGEDLGVFLTENLHQNRIALLPILPAHSATVSTLPFHHKDPFGRLRIAQSIVEQMPLISIDAVFDHYGIQRIW